MAITIDSRTQVNLVAKARRVARRHGCRITKSRQRFHINNLGGFQVVDRYRNEVIAGSNYDCTPEEIIESLPTWVASAKQDKRYE